MPTQPYLGETPLYPASTYVRTLRPLLPPEVFRPAYARLAFVPVFATLAVTAIVAIARGWVPWPVVPLLSLVIGASFAGLTFVAHETMHGGTVRRRWIKHAISWLGFAHFNVSPLLWAAWHDRVHHATANTATDPDMYPTFEEYNAARGGGARFSIDHFALGGRRLRGVLSLILGFTVQSANQLRLAHQLDFLRGSRLRIAKLETALMVALWLTLAFVVGFVPFLFIYVMPLVVANVIVMAFILTNHNLSPRIAINDPLISSLSVTTPRLITFLTLGFGYHVEHHLFPSMSTRHGARVRDLLREHWPERYQSMPLTDAVAMLHRTSRLYKDATTLVDPRTGEEYSTLLPSPRAAQSPKGPAAVPSGPALAEAA